MEGVVLLKAHLAIVSSDECLPTLKDVEAFWDVVINFVTLLRWSI